MYQVWTRRTWVLISLRCALKFREILEKELENLARQHRIDPYSLGDLGEVKPSPELQQEIRAYRIRMAMTGGSRPNLTEAEKKVESEAIGSTETINQEK